MICQFLPHISFFFFNDTATTEIYTLSLHDALPICLDGKTGFGRYDTRGYTTVDLISQWKIDPKNRVSLGVENLFNRQYFPLYSQLLRSNNNTSRLPAAGTVLKISYAHTW